MDDRITLPDITPIKALRDLPPDICDQINTALQIVLDSALHNVTQVWLFGSHARGDFIHDRRYTRKRSLRSHFLVYRRWPRYHRYY